jgi:hypothetical protein
MHEFNSCSGRQSLLAVTSGDRKLRVRRARLSFCSRFNDLMFQRAVRQHHQWNARETTLPGLAFKLPHETIEKLNAIAG